MRSADLTDQRRSALLPPVLCYHRIGGPAELGVTRVAKSVFARQMTTLARAGWKTLTLDQFAERLRPGHSAFHTPQSAFLLTFDDGYASLAEHVYPVLADVGFTATTFLITDYVGRLNSWDVRYTWDRLERLARAAGYELGFGGVRGNGSPLALARLPVYVWDVGSIPVGLQGGTSGAMGRFVAHAANRCAVGTSVMQGIRSWVSGVRASHTHHLTPDA